jgi:hypothetical protein
MPKKPMKTLVILPCTICVAVIVAAMVTAIFKTDFIGKHPLKKPPTPTNYAMMTNNPLPPLAPTNPTKQHYSTEDVNK